jgi:predicted AAA+ superfamily ATPase
MKIRNRHAEFHDSSNLYSRPIMQPPRYSRILPLAQLLKQKSFFLFGPRASGKTTLIDSVLPDALVIDLLHTATYASLVRNPSALEEIIAARSAQSSTHGRGASADHSSPQIVVIDEVQKLPNILDEVQRLMHSRRITFLLTGSSARKLKHGGANLLAGRAREARLFPLTSAEIPQFDLIRYLNVGGLPAIYDSTEPNEDLAAYVDTYLREEIKAEAVTRNIGAFAEFLDAIALCNGQEIQYESLASDLQVSAGTVKNYLQILEDTLIGFRLPGFTATRKRKALVRSKHYLFDLGVTRHLAKGGEISAKSKAFGDAFEHFIVLELRAFLSYHRLRHELTYWRTTSLFEVDIIVGSTWAIEIKATEHPSDKHLRGLRALREEGICREYMLICFCEHERLTSDGIRIIPWRVFLKGLWGGGIIS